MHKALPFLWLVMYGCGAQESRLSETDCTLQGQLEEIQSGPDAGTSVALLVCPQTAEGQTDDQLPVRVALANVSDSPIQIRPSLVFGAWLNASIVGPDGQPLPQVEHVDPSRPPSVNLAPGAMVDTTINLLCPLGTAESPAGCVRPYELDLPGMYQVTMHYTYRCEDGPCPRAASERHTVHARPFTVTIER